MKKTQDHDKQLSLTFDTLETKSVPDSEMSEVNNIGNVVHVNFPTNRSGKSFRDSVISDLILNRVIYEG